MNPHRPRAEDLLAHAAWLRPLAAQLVGWDASEDVLQETWRTALERPLRSRAALPAWLARVARNAALQRRRSEKARAAREAQSAPRRGEEPADAVLERAELHRRLVDEVLALEEPYRTVLLLRWFEERSPTEIAQMLGSSPGTVRSQLKRGLERLRERLDRRFDGGRDGWIAALLPLVRGPQGLAAVGGATTALGALLVTVKAHHVLWILLLVLLGAGALLWWANTRAAREERASAPDAGATAAATAAAGREETPPPVLFGRAPGASETLTGALLGRVADAATGRGLPGARLLLTPRADTAGEARRGSADEGGRFAFEDVTVPGTWLLRVEAEGRPTRVLPLDLLAPRRRDLGTIWLGTPGGVAGVVRDEAGRPIVGAEVRAFPGHGGTQDMSKHLADVLSGLDREPRALVEERTDVEGRFTLDGVPPGVVTVVARVPGRQPGRVQVGIAAGERLAGLEIVLHDGVGVRGVVVDERGVPLAGARVAAAPTSNDLDAVLYGRLFARTDAQGRFVLEGLNPGCATAIFAAYPGRPTLFQKLVPGQASDLRLVLSRGATLLLAVGDGTDGAPAAGVQVTIVLGDSLDMGDRGPQTVLYGVTADDGSLSLDARPGYVLVAMFLHGTKGAGGWLGRMAGTSPAPPGMVQGPPSARVEPGRQRLAFTLPAGVPVEGRVTDAHGRPVPDALVRTVRPGFPSSPGTRVDAEGRYRLVLHPGEHLLATAPGWWHPVESRGVSLARDGDGPVTHDVVLEPAQVVTGRVLDPEGKGAAGALVRLRGAPAEDGDRRTFARADGGYLFTDVPPGPAYRVLARLPGYADATTEEPFAVPAGPPARAPDVMLRRGVVLEIRVRDAGGAPVAGAHVGLAVGADPTRLWDPLGDGDLARRTDAGGELRAGPFPPGRVRVQVDDERYAPYLAEVDLAEDETRTRTLEVHLVEGGRLEGRVLDPSGRSVARAILFVESAEPTRPFQRRADVDADGVFHVAGLPDAPLRLHVRATGYRARTLETEAGTSTLDVVLQPEDAGVTARRDELVTRMQALALQAQVADEATRARLQQEMQAIARELQELEAR